MSVLPSVVTRHWRLKLAALGLAIFMWAVLGTDAAIPGTRTVSGVPVVVEFSDPGWTTASPPEPAVVDVQLSGTGRDGAGIVQNLVVRIPIDSVTSADTVVQLRRDWVEGRSDVAVSLILPQRVRLRFEQIRMVARPVTLETTGSLPAGMALAQHLSVQPPVVRVSGRAARVEALDSVSVGPLDLGSIRESRSVTLPIDTAGFGDLSFEVTEATVDVRVEPAIERNLTGVPVRLGSGTASSASFTFEPSEVGVTLRGGRTRVLQAPAESFHAVVDPDDVAHLEEGETARVRIRIGGLPDLTTATSEVQTVTVRRVGG